MLVSTLSRDEAAEVFVGEAADRFYGLGGAGRPRQGLQVGQRRRLEMARGGLALEADAIRGFD